MAIPASQIVKINPRVIQASGTDLVLNGMFLTTNSLIPAGSVMSFSSADDVGAFFGTASDEYKAAAVYFGGYKNSFKKPRQIHFGSRVMTAVYAWLRSARYTGTLAQLKAVTSGTLTLTINETEVAVSGLSFASATSYSDVASTIQTALAGELASTTCTYDSQTGAFQITSPTSGAYSTITYCIEGTLATLLGFTEAKGAVISQGSAALDVPTNMAKIREATENWATVTCLPNVEIPLEDDNLALSAWASAQGVEYLFVCWSTDSNLKNQVDTTSIAYKLKQANAGATTLVYGDYRYAAFIMGTVASIDWDRTQGAITLAFKSQDGLVPTIDNATDATTLLQKKCNIYGTYATRNDDFVWLYDSNMFGDYNFIDPFINAIWFNNSLQVAIMNGLEMCPRVPYNEDGYTLIRSWCQDPINRALKNGVIDPGLNLSEAQKAELIREAGLDITSNLQTDGWYLVVRDPGAHVRTTRDTPEISLFYSYAGSIHRIELASTLFI